MVRQARESHGVVLFGIEWRLECMRHQLAGLAHGHSMGACVGSMHEPFAVCKVTAVPRPTVITNAITAVSC